MSLKELEESVGGSGGEFVKPEPMPKMITVKGFGIHAGKTWSEWLKVMEPEEELRRDRRLATFFGGAVVESFPNYGKWHALATIRTLWPDLPDWLDWLVTRDDSVAIAIAEEVAKYEQSFRNDSVGTGEKDKGESGFSVFAGDDPEDTDSLGGG